MFKKKIISLIIIALLTISSIGDCSAWLTLEITNCMEPNHKSVRVDCIKLYSDYEGHNKVYQVKDPIGLDNNHIGFVIPMSIDCNRFGIVRRIKFCTHIGKDVNIYLDYPYSNTFDKNKIVKLDLIGGYLPVDWYKNEYVFHFNDKYNYGIQEFNAKNVIIDCSNDVVTHGDS